MHGIGANQNELSAGLLQFFRGIAKVLRALFPVSAGLALFDLIKFHTLQDDPCAMESAELLLDILIDDGIIRDGALPAHPAEEPDRLHFHSSPSNMDIASFSCYGYSLIYSVSAGGIPSSSVI